MEKTDSLAFIEKKSSRRVLPRVKDEEIKIDRARKLTHLYMHGNFITDIGDISICKNLTVLYLHENEISKIENLDSATNLQCLYLQKNKIQKIENLDKLVKLQKLYIGHNYIGVLEGLENQVNLLELHIEKQKLAEGDGLCFDPRSVMSLSKNLQVLNISNNRITTLKNLLPLHYLHQLNASKNLLNDIKDICDTIRDWYYLQEASFVGNPISKVHRYRESIIECTEHLSTLDGKIVTDINRKFIKRFEQEKLQHGPSRQSINLADMVKSLPKHYPPPMQKAVTASILENNKLKLELNNISKDVEVQDIYVPWKVLPKPDTLKLKHRKKKGAQKRTTVKSIVKNIKFSV